MTLQERVAEYLKNVPQCRENDNLLIAYCIKDEYGTRDLYDIALKTKSNIYESISRARRKIQEENPLLRPSDEVYKAREQKEQEVRQWARGV